MRSKSSFQGCTAVLARMINAGRTDGLRLALKRSVTGASLKTRRHAFHTPHAPRPRRGHASPADCFCSSGKGTLASYAVPRSCPQAKPQESPTEPAAFVIPFSQTICQSLKTRGKHPLAAVGSASRKLHIIIFTTFRENRPYKTTSPKKGGQNI